MSQRLNLLGGLDSFLLPCPMSLMIPCYALFLAFGSLMEIAGPFKVVQLTGGRAVTASWIWFGGWPEAGGKLDFSGGRQMPGFL